MLKNIDYPAVLRCLKCSKSFFRKKKTKKSIYKCEICFSFIGVKLYNSIWNMLHQLQALYTGTCPESPSCLEWSTVDVMVVGGANPVQCERNSWTSCVARVRDVTVFAGAVVLLHHTERQTDSHPAEPTHTPGPEGRAAHRTGSVSVWVNCSGRTAHRTVAAFPSRTTSTTSHRAHM